jgi:hypothetical protein
MAHRRRQFDGDRRWRACRAPTAACVAFVHSMNSPSTFMGTMGMKKNVNHRRAICRRNERSTPQFGQ